MFAHIVCGRSGLFAHTLCGPNNKCKIIDIDTTRKNVDTAQGLNTHKMFPSQQPIGIFRRSKASLAPTLLVGQLVRHTFKCLLCRRLWTVIECPWSTVRYIFSKSYDQQLLDFY